ncbi:unnamed protein product [Withania somnifera]
MARKNIFLHYNILLINFLAFLFLVTETAPQSALVTQIPGFNGNFQSKHYAGYVTIDESRGKKMYYYFVESERNPSKDPVVLWLNGGPGCSSFDGFVYEHGPFNFELGKANGSLPVLHNNPYSWSKVSSVIYLDSPVGVGFSYSGNQSDYVTGDLKTASDTHSFLLKWFEIYSEFLTNPFYISGESYAGIYVPTLSHEVVKGIDAGVKPAINFKGYMVGNGVTDEEIDGNALVPFQHGMGLISDELYKEVTVACNGNFHKPVSQNCKENLDKIERVRCYSVILDLFCRGSNSCFIGPNSPFRILQDVSDLNVYDILEPCYHSKDASGITSDNSKLPMSFHKLGETERPFPVRKRMFGRAWPFKAPVREGHVPTWPEILNGLLNVPCTDDRVATEWLNNEDVRKAIHAEQATVTGPWQLCTNNIKFSHDAGSMIQYHKNLTTLGYRALIYSGDHDMCVPFTGSKNGQVHLDTRLLMHGGLGMWMIKLQWMNYVQGYAKNLTFLTIKGAGHTVPEYKPREALAFYDRWLQAKNI